MKFDKLPLEMQNEVVKKAYQFLNKKWLNFFIKRIFDFIVSFLLIIILFPLIIIISIFIKMTSPGPIIYKQIRVTKNCKLFKIYKFRTMVNGADKMGSQITISNDKRITKVGKFLRKYRLDEIPQLFNILLGEMSFVGPRPEVKKYVDKYTNEMYSTLLIKSGLTSIASIKYKDEEKLLFQGKNVDETYTNVVLPEKMKYNYEYLKNQNIILDINILFETVLSIFFNRNKL